VEVSIIVAARNEEKHLKDCVESLLAQTYKDFEILIIDGESDDKTFSIAKKLAKKQNIRVFSNPQRRAAEARNIGIKNARGELIGYIDAHTTAHKDWLKALVSTVKKATWEGRPIGGVGSVHKNPKKEPFTDAVTEAFQHPFGGGGSSYRVRGKVRAVDTAYACLYRREALEAIRHKNGNYYDPYFIKGQDAELNWRINKAGYVLLQQPKALTYYYKRNTWDAFWRQMYVAGFWRMKISKKHHDLFKPTLFAPLILYKAIFFCLIRSNWFPTAIISGVLLLIYLIATIIPSLKSKSPFTVITMVWMIHLAYTAGLIKGFFSKTIMTRDRV